MPETLLEDPYLEGPSRLDATSHASRVDINAFAFDAAEDKPFAASDFFSQWLRTSASPS